MAAREERKIQLFVSHILGNGSIPVEVPAEGTMLDIKKEIEKKNQMPIEQQKLIYAGNELLSHYKISDFRLTNDTAIHLIKRSASNGSFFSSSSSSSLLSNSTHSLFKEEKEEKEDKELIEYQRASYRELPVAQFPPYGLPGGKDFTQENIHLYCKGHSQHVSCGVDSYGDAYPESLQQGVVRPRCRECKSEAIFIENSPALTWNVVCDISFPITGECFQCGDGEKRSIEFYYRCRGPLVVPKEDGATLCGLVSLDTNVISPLPGVLKNVEDVLSEDTQSADAVQIVFHPCGHRINANGLSVYLKNKSRRSLLRNQFATEQLGKFVLKCFHTTCLGILPLPSIKLAGIESYQKIKDWAVEEKVLAEGGVLCSQCMRAFEAPSTQFKHLCPYCEQEICEIHETLLARCYHSNTLTDSFAARVAEVFTKGSCQDCPNKCYSGLGVQKIEKYCTHMFCEKCKEGWCYFCGRSKPEKHCTNGCPIFLDDYELTRAISEERVLLRFHRLKTLRLLRRLREEFNKEMPGEFDKLFPALPKPSRTVVLAPGDPLLPEMEISLFHVKQPPPLADFILNDDAQTKSGQHR